MVTTDFENTCSWAVYTMFMVTDVIPSSAEARSLCVRARDLFFDGGEIDPDGTGDKIAEVSTRECVLILSLKPLTLLSI
jgi:hypothetical protein